MKEKGKEENSKVERPSSTSQLRHHTHGTGVYVHLKNRQRGFKKLFEGERRTRKRSPVYETNAENSGRKEERGKRSFLILSSCLVCFLFHKEIEENSFSLALLPVLRLFYNRHFRSSSSPVWPSAHPESAPMRDFFLLLSLAFFFSALLRRCHSQTARQTEDVPPEELLSLSLPQLAV